MGDISLRGKGRALLKKGGSMKKGILIIVGTKDKEPKKIKKGMHKMPDGKMMKNSDMKKGKK